MRIRVQTPRHRGSMMLGYATLVVVLAIACGVALQRSLETYRTSALAVQKIQARAAAEGAAVTWSRGAAQPGSPMVLGECTVQLQDAATSDSLLLNVAVHPAGSMKAALTARYVAQVDPVSRKIQNLELRP